VLDKAKSIGFAFTIAAFTMWGFLPIYWKLLKEASALEILSHRIVWSFVFVLIILAFRHRLKVWRDYRRKDIVPLIAMAILVGGNWLVYILAVNSDRILEASMGYYINPLFSIFLGMVFLRERLRGLKVLAFLLAILGVLYITLEYGKLPWIALSLATMFSLYGLLKKISRPDPMQALWMETLLLSPLAFGYMLILARAGDGSFLSGGISMTALLLFAGVVTTLPLYWFAEGTRRIELSSVGFLQFIAPSIMMVIGIVLYGEVFTTTHAISFGLIWTGLGLYSISMIKAMKRTLKYRNLYFF